MKDKRVAQAKERKYSSQVPNTDKYIRRSKKISFSMHQTIAEEYIENSDSIENKNAHTNTKKNCNNRMLYNI